MPPKPIIDKETMIQSAVNLIREQGIYALNARSLANVLGCSTKPIFRLYENMDELKKSVYERVENLYNKHMEEGLKNGFEGLGMAYISFAKQEKNLFKLIFMSEQFKIENMREMLEGNENEQIINLISETSGLGSASARELYMSMWLISHGIASMIATNSCRLQQEEIKKILNNTYSALITQLKLKKNSKIGD